MKKTIKWIINDLKTDIECLSQLFRGEYKLTEKKKEELKNAFSIKGLFKENWIWLLLIIASFFCGCFIAAVHYQNVVNEFLTNFSQTCYAAKEIAFNLSSNITFLK